MIIDRKNAVSVDYDPQVKPFRVYSYSDMEIRCYLNPASPSEITASDASAAVWHNGKCIFAAAAEKDDLRAMSLYSGIPIRELQEDYGVRGFYSNARIVAYGNGERENMGQMLESPGREGLFQILLTVIDDAFDAGEMKEIK